MVKFTKQVFFFLFQNDKSREQLSTASSILPRTAELQALCPIQDQLIQLNDGLIEVLKKTAENDLW
jgi:hypothetical protein